MDASQLLRSAVDAAHAAGEILREGFGTAVTSRSKEGRHNLVTEFDLRCEDTIIAMLRSATPTASFLAEESGGSDNDDSLTWVIDPLDGTVNFAHGIPIFCVSIAATVNGVPVCGVIHNPLLNETFTAISGGGAFLNGAKLQVSPTATLNDAILVTGFPYNVDENPQHCIEQFSAIVSKGLPVRRLGSAALDLAYTAAGRFDGFWEVALHAWDMAAGVLLVQEAGGTVTHYEGRPFRLGHDSIIATNGLIHGELVNILTSVDR
ncbi:MAG: inositol monophosphatase [Ignavibacteria bacterium]|nr:inositol monophosphatase [Ignavibacteria bacterium]